ncbi:MAG: iron chelate uptake ABC transporter family permease subunit [Piscinibacter sp.]
MLLAVPLLARGLERAAARRGGSLPSRHPGPAHEDASPSSWWRPRVGASVAAAGVIGFVGIVVPHLLRLAVGPDHRILLPLAALLGGDALLTGADTARPHHRRPRRTADRHPHRRHRRAVLPLAAARPGTGAWTMTADHRGARRRRPLGRHKPVDDVSLELRAGELLVVVGPNGAGKTTLMQLLTGEIQPSDGRRAVRRPAARRHSRLAARRPPRRDGAGQPPRLPLHASRKWCASASTASAAPYPAPSATG